MSDSYRDGVVRRRVTLLRPGDKVDLQNDPIADPLDENDPEAPRDHPEFAFEFEVVRRVVYEAARGTDRSDDVVRVNFESGFSCGFPTDHEIEVDGEQVVHGGMRKPLAWNGRRRA